MTGTPALFYEGGILFVQMFVSVFACSTATYVLGPRISRIGRERSCVTQSELFASHHRSRTLQGLTGALGVLSLLSFLAIQLVGIGKVLSATSRGAIGIEL